MSFRHKLLQNILGISFAFIFVTACSIEFNRPAELIEDDTDYEFVIDAVEWTLYHEAGHALIDQLRLPVIGQQEDAADVFATLAITRSYEADDARRILENAAEAWSIMFFEDSEGQNAAIFFDEHDFSLQRAYRIICQAYGDNPDQYKDSADWVDLPERTRSKCIRDAEVMFNSWLTVLEEFFRTDNDPVSQISLSKIPTEAYLDEVALLDEYPLLEAFSDNLRNSFKWPNGLNVFAKECGEENAFYNPEEVSITLCYEWLQKMVRIERTRSY